MMSTVSLNRFFSVLILMVMAFCSIASAQQSFDTWAVCGTGCGNPCTLQEGWSNVGEVDWTVDTGGTGSASTGPSAGCGGAGNYLYCETSCSGTGYPSKTFDLRPPTGLPAGDLSFSYHMMGQNIGDLYVEELDSSGNWQTLWSKHGQQNTVPIIWNTATVATTGGDLRFRYVSGSSFAGDCAIDQVSLPGDPPNPSLVGCGLTGVGPVAAFTSVVTAGAAPLSVQFTDQTTGGVSQWAWDFGNGYTSSFQNPQHTYTSGGIYTVTLIATNSWGTDTLVKTDYISVYEPRMTMIQSAATSDLTIDFLGGQPNAQYFALYSFDPMNGTHPGSGLFAGMHLSFSGAQNQINSGLGGDPIFGGVLDGAGVATASYNQPGLLALSGTTVWAKAIYVDHSSTNTNYELTDLLTYTFQ